MDGGYLTAVRTGAASGVATRYLAREDKGQIAGIFGSGVQARMQLWAMAEARQLGGAVVYDIIPEAAQKFAAEMGAKLGLEIRVAARPDEVLQADLICAATSANDPIFKGADVRPGTHINGIGSHSPGQRELDTDIVKRSLFVGDSREACFGEAGDILIPIKEGAITEDHYYADLGEIITGKKKGRTDAQMITLFKSNGLAIQDVATAKLVYDRAVAAGVGKEIEI
jgi:ornithine cyclodeaminase/alanine dehydrogenase